MSAGRRSVRFLRVLSPFSAGRSLSGFSKGGVRFPPSNDRNGHMNFIAPPEEELTYLRADPLLVEQELDVRPDVAKAIEHAAGRRAGRVYWRSEHHHLFALGLGDLGRGQPPLAPAFVFWDRFEPP